MTVPTPNDLIAAKLNKLRNNLVRGWQKREMDFKVGDRVTLPALDPDVPHVGTVTEIRHDAFRVTWDYEPTERYPRRPTGMVRERHWYPNNRIDTFGRA